MHRVVVLALDGVYPFELSIPARIFGTAFDTDGAPLYEVLTCTLDGRPVRSNADFGIAVEQDLTALHTADTIVIPPFVGCGSESAADWLPAELAQVFDGLRPEVRIVSICTAAYVLAAAGLLDGMPATTHWNRAADFQRTFPQVHVDPTVLFIDPGRVLTAAGAAAGIDLCLHLVRRDHGTAVANRVARLCVVAPWRAGGQAQFIERPVPEPASSPITDTRAWALRHLDRPLTLSELAEQARMSVRTFCRRFRDEVGVPPGQWLTQQRVDQACLLLETTDLPIDRVATDSGFGTAAALRQHLTATLGVSPTAYRRTFRAAATKPVTPAEGPLSVTALMDRFEGLGKAFQAAGLEPRIPDRHHDR
ncbi:GlxA family transcriptional regulator [Nocardia sp. NPDC127579]|uniref:GlxA family transcriptional regulator n=1 Tax=Nocardia sp. NPDC127579 TaxID=3345402 RepID=UPI003624D7FD